MARKITSLVLCLFFITTVAPIVVTAQHCEPVACCGPVYRPACQTIYVPRPVNTCRVQNNLVYEQRTITTYQPVWETEIRECHYTVARPETQTVEREQRYTVLNPVWETQIRDESYDVVREVIETHEREEQFTVSRPVWETQHRDQTYQVRRYVTRTVQRQVPNVRYAPVTTMQTSYVDRGRYVTQQVQRQGWSPNLLRWSPGGWQVDPATGKRKYQIAGLAWQKQPAPVRTVARQVWQPNPVAVQVPRTNYQRVVTNVQVPTQVGDWVVESVVRKVPVRVCKTVTEQRVRKVPYTTVRQVTERVENKIPVRVCKYLREERVRNILCTYTRMMYEQCVQKVPVRVCRMVAVQQTILVPRCIPTIVPVQQPYYVPRTVMLQIPYSVATSQHAETQDEAPALSSAEAADTDAASPAAATRSVLRRADSRQDQPADNDGWRPRIG